MIVINLQIHLLISFFDILYIIIMFKKTEKL